MKRVPIDECPAGPELDKIVIEVLVKAKNLHEEYGWWKDSDGKGIIPACYDCNGEPSFSPSRYIAAAWELAEEEDLFAHRYLTKTEDGKYTICDKSIGFGEWPEYYAGADESISLTITRAYLKAKGVEFVEVPE